MKSFRTALCIAPVLLLTPSCAKKADVLVQEQVRTFAGANLDEDQVQIGEIRQSGSNALADVTIKTTVKLKQENGKWVIEEVRLGDRHWESADHIRAVLDRERTSETSQNLEALQRGIEDYLQKEGEVPQVRTFVDLVDILTPNYMSRVIRLDGWAQGFSYRPLSKSSYDLRSPGPDRALGTADDIVVEGGR